MKCNLYPCICSDVTCTYNRNNLLSAEALAISHLNIRDSRELSFVSELASVSDKLFYHLPEKEREKMMMYSLLVSHNPDLSKAWAHFATWLLTDAVDGVVTCAQTENEKLVINKVSELYSQSLGREIPPDEWRDAYTIAYTRPQTYPIKVATYAAEAALNRSLNKSQEQVSDSAKITCYFAARAHGENENQHFIKQSEKLIELFKFYGSKDAQ